MNHVMIHQEIGLECSAPTRPVVAFERYDATSRPATSTVGTIMVQTSATTSTIRNVLTTQRTMPNRLEACSFQSGFPSTFTLK